jgi:hypothetical protein
MEILGNGKQGVAASIGAIRHLNRVIIRVPIERGVVRGL